MLVLSSPSTRSALLAGAAWSRYAPQSKPDEVRDDTSPTRLVVTGREHGRPCVWSGGPLPLYRTSCDSGDILTGPRRSWLLVLDPQDLLSLRKRVPRPPVSGFGSTAVPVKGCRRRGSRAATVVGTREGPNTDVARSETEAHCTGGGSQTQKRRGFLWSVIYSRD